MNIYNETAKIVKSIKQKKGTVKSLVFASRFHNKRKLYALVCETLKFWQILSLLLKRTKIPRKLTSYEEKQYVFIVLLYEFLIGQGLDKAGMIAKQFLRYKLVIEREHGRLLAEKQVSSLSELIPEEAHAISLPRYVRVNLLRTTAQEAADTFMKEGWRLVKGTKNFVHDMQKLGQREFLQDPHLPDLLVFPPGTDFHKHRLCTTGEIILQDKASCFPAHVLSPPEGSVVIDSCAAPGNKTSHVASLLRNSGKVFAFDKDRRRLKTMSQLLEVAGVTNTEQTCQDFLSVDPLEEKYAAVEYMLVDPSCSGSGIVGRLNHLSDDDNSTAARLKSLSNFQATILKHALSFPRVKRVVYSTCSIHAQENEEVVEEVIQKVGEDFKLKLVFTDWSNRGVKGYEHAPMCLRMSPEDNLTNGFFVACFERRRFQGNGSHGEKEGVGCSESRLTLNNGDESTRTFTRKEKKRLKKKAKKAQKNLLLSSGVTEFERDDKDEGEDVDNCASKDDRKMKIIPKSEDLDSSYLATETEEVLRVDNSLPCATPVKTVFCGGQKHMGKASVESERVRMFRKRSIEFLDVSNLSCCVLQCTPSGEAGKRAKQLSNVVGFGSMVRNAELTEKTFGAHGDASRHELVTGVKSHSSTEKRKLKKLRRKKKQSEGFSFSG
ncbi:28S rRNA (cytosine-C(5))-methyltransferase-like [Haliotis rufescens]|uniref:28S rRNA (cytosine-C(5))-methyltransferase-like n=1 Tax=Haliotis rufescens TaxID=6454 RepID=UPI00201F8A76|nr:28S rRNA (cytosine-C(5))-methyltransferase-like [Haliotis rufescens]